MATTPQHNGPAPVVFLVDDEEPIRELIGMALSGRGYTVHTCAESRKASAMAAALPNAPDLLITDIHMAGLAGPDLAAQMSAQFPGLRILFISAQAVFIAGISRDRGQGADREAMNRAAMDRLAVKRLQRSGGQDMF
jgi:CheY-like chemotaxis protein